MKKIILFEAYPFFSGSQRILLNLCEILKRKKYYITLILADDQYGILRDKFANVADEIILLNLDKKLLVYGNFRRWLNPLNIIRSLLTGLVPFYIKTFNIIKKQKADYFYYYDPRGAALFLPTIIFFKGKKVFHLLSKNRLPDFIARFFMKFSDVIICGSNGVFNSLPPSLKKICIYNGVDYSQYSNIDSENAFSKINEILNINKSNVKSNEPVKLLFVGLIRPAKGLHHIIETLGLIKNNSLINPLPHLFILGAPKEDSEKLYKDYLIQRSISLEIHDSIHWVGWESNVLGYMSVSDYLIFPTVNKEKSTFKGFDTITESTECLPTVLIEAGLCNLFSIASNVTGVNEIIKENENGYTYNPDDPTGLYKTLEKVLLEKTKFVKFSQRNLFSTEIYESKMIKIFEDT